MDNKTPEKTHQIPLENELAHFRSTEIPTIFNDVTQPSRI